MKRVKVLLAAVLWLCIWQLAAWLTDNSILFAGPAETMLALAKGACTWYFWQTVGVSLLRILGGFLLAALLGSLLGVLAHRFSPAESFFSPFMHFCKAVPVASFAVILLIWWGSAWLSVAICFLVALPLFYVNVLAGLRDADRQLLEMAAVFEVPLFNRIFYIYRPAAASYMESCIRTAMGMGIKAGIAAEVIGVPRFSIGGEIYMSKIYLNTAEVFAWTAVVIGLSVCMEKGALYLWRSTLAWKPRPHAPRRETGATDISIENLGWSYGDKQVLNGITKHLRAGETYWLMAPSGAGKTTLLHLLAGILSPKTGRLEGAGKNISMVFQEDRLLGGESAVCNVTFVCGEEEKAVGYLRELLPEETLYKPVETLSGGERRRVCAARAVAAGGTWILLDEPFNGLDGENRRRTAEFIERHRGERGVLAVTHEQQDVSLLEGESWTLA